MNKIILLILIVVGLAACSTSKTAGALWCDQKYHAYTDNNIGWGVTGYSWDEATGTCTLERGSNPAFTFNVFIEQMDAKWTQELQDSTIATNTAKWNEAQTAP
jgi:hypothetical protein